MPELSDPAKKPSSHDQDIAAPAAHGAASTDTGRYPKPTPEQADRIIASKLGGSGAAAQSSVASGATASPMVDFGDQEIGKQTFAEAFVWNTESIEANVVAHVEGHPAIQLVSAPERIFPSSDPMVNNDRGNRFKLVFSPTARERVSGQLRVSLSWRADARPPVELVIPIEGAAHPAGAPTFAEETEEQEQHHKAQRDQKAREATHRKDEEDEARQWTEKPRDKRQGDDQLRDATEDAQRALVGLYEDRRTGVSIANTEAAAYTRRQPPHEESLMTALAKLGLDIATAGIAGYIGKRLEGPLEKILSTVVAAHKAPLAGEFAKRAVEASKVIPSKQLIALFTDTVKQSVKSAGKGAQPSDHAHDANASEHADSNEGALSENPLLDFFAREDNALTVDKDGEARQIAMRMRAELEPMLDDPSDDKVQAKGAVAAMKGIAVGIRESYGWASREQGQASALHWIRYLSQVNLGTLAPDTARAAGKHPSTDSTPLSDTTGIAAAPTAAGGPAEVGGLVDVEFAASAVHPEMPAAVHKVYVKGASNIIARRLAKQSLLDAHVAVRAHGTSSDGDAVLPVTVVRDEAGNLTYSDETGAPGVPARWLSRKAGDLHGGPAAELRGARKLMEEELMSKPIDRERIKTDSSDDPRGPLAVSPKH